MSLATSYWRAVTKAERLTTRKGCLTRDGRIPSSEKEAER